ncbi:hypothetical protein SDC9_208563 [bioreactor metagenome]|uniref:Uncharacterized protein n=1 Tax=bioreactor metagenome TaxID=1076179 RepID=A0A645JB36_9ZZZZ
MENFVSKGKPESCSDSENSLLTRRVEIWSFGYKYGAMDADAVFVCKILEKRNFCGHSAQLNTSSGIQEILIGHRTQIIGSL